MSAYDSPYRPGLATGKPRAGLAGAVAALFEEVAKLISIAGGGCLNRDAANLPRQAPRPRRGAPPALFDTRRRDTLNKTPS